MQIALARGWCFARIDDDPASTVITLLPEELVEDGKSFSAIRSSDQQHFCKRNVIPRIGGTIDSESFVIARGSRDHTEPSVVINVASAESGARKFAHQVS